MSKGPHPPVDTLVRATCHQTTNKFARDRLSPCTEFHGLCVIERGVWGDALFASTAVISFGSLNQSDYRGGPSNGESCWAHRYAPLQAPAFSFDQLRETCRGRHSLLQDQAIRRVRLTRTRRSTWMVGLLMMSLAFTSSDTVGKPAPTRYRRNTTQVAPGIKLIRILDRRGPNRIKVLSIDPESRMTIDSVLSNDRLPGFETTSSMTRRRGAIAAINGDYGLPWGRPPHVFGEDGVLRQRPSRGGGRSRSP